MRVGMVLAVLALAGCGSSAADMDAANARRICAGNGHAQGSPGFDACFATTFRDIRGVRVN
jgi:hypothetical protein